MTKKSRKKNKKTDKKNFFKINDDICENLTYAVTSILQNIKKSYKNHTN